MSSVRPSRERVEPREPPAAAPAAPQRPAPQTTRYKVERGDTAWDIARDHGIDVRTLRRANREIGSGRRLRPGQVLNIPTLRSPGRPPGSPVVNGPRTSVPLRPSEPPARSEALTAAPAGDPRARAEREAARFGERRGEHVRSLQQHLARAGFAPEGGDDGKRGRHTDDAVRRFQRANGLGDRDGRIDADTLLALWRGSGEREAAAVPPPPARAPTASAAPAPAAAPASVTPAAPPSEPLPVNRTAAAPRAETPPNPERVAASFEQRDPADVRALQRLLGFEGARVTGELDAATSAAINAFIDREQLTGSPRPPRGGEAWRQNYQPDAATVRALQTRAAERAMAARPDGDRARPLSEAERAQIPQFAYKETPVERWTRVGSVAAQRIADQTGNQELARVFPSLVSGVGRHESARGFWALSYLERGQAERAVGYHQILPTTAEAHVLRNHTHYVARHGFPSNMTPAQLRGLEDPDPARRAAADQRLAARYTELKGQRLTADQAFERLVSEGLISRERAAAIRPAFDDVVRNLAHNRVNFPIGAEYLADQVVAARARLPEAIHRQQVEAFERRRTQLLQRARTPRQRARILALAAPTSYAERVTTLARRLYHGGPDESRWGPRNRAYVGVTTRAQLHVPFVPSLANVFSRMPGI